MKAATLFSGQGESYRMDGVEDSDFAAFLSAVRECGYLGCYRVFDAQYSGVPQRRRRIFLVGRLGDWRGPFSVLFEPESLRGDSPPSRETREVAGTVKASLARCSADEAECGTLVIPANPDIFKPSHFTRDKDGAPSGVAPPLGREPDKGDQEAVLFTGTAVRRLTPTECERLQGFEDGFTAVKFGSKLAADGPRYKALGNAMNVKDIRAILQRIERFHLEASA